MSTNTSRPDKTDGTNLSNDDAEQPVIDQLKAAIRGPDAQCGNSPVAVIAYAERQSTADFREAADALKRLLDRGDVVRTDGGLQLVETDGGVPKGDLTASPHPTTCTRFQLDQLAAIAQLQATETVTSGAAIRDHLEAYLGAEVLPARIYQNLDDLADAGLLERTQYDGRTYEYALTAAGHACLHERIQWLADQAGRRVVDVNPDPDGDGDGDGDAPDTHSDGGTPIRSDGGRDRRFRRDVVVGRVLSQSQSNPSSQLIVDPSLRPDGGPPTAETPIDRHEAERHARQAAQSLDQWSRAARLDLLAILQAETPVILPVETERLSTHRTGGPQR